MAGGELIKVTHLAPYARGRGGVETLLTLHAVTDLQRGLDSMQVGLFEKHRDPATRTYRPMEFGGWKTPGFMRRAMATTLATHPGSVTVWHMGWGLPWFADADASARRIVGLHADVGWFSPWLRQVSGLLDGIVVISNGAIADVRRLLPAFPVERIVNLALPISPPSVVDRRPDVGPTWVIGCSGRLERAQKRWDRLVPFVAELRRQGVKFRVEVMGAGRLRPWLERQFRGQDDVRFFDFAGKPEYWRRLETWDAAAFFSDLEGGPIVLIEAMAMGTLPIYPGIGGSLGDDYAPRVDARCHYPPGDPIAAARQLCALLRSAPTEVATLRARAQELARPHCNAGYEKAFAEFVQRIASLPRISAVPTGRVRRRWFDPIPLGLLTRLYPDSVWH